MNTQDIKDSKNLNAPSKGNVPALRFPEFTEEWTAETIDELFELRNGYTPSKNNLDFWNNGTIPWFRMEDIRLNGGVLKDAIQHITPEAVKGSGLFEPYSIILATTATIGEHAMLIADSLANQRFTNFKIRKSLTYKYNPYYLYYYFFKIDKWCLKNTNAGGLLSVDIPSLKRQKLYSPSVEEQNKIAKLLRLIDDRISIQSRIIEKYETLIKGIVDFIFTVNKFPKVPFKEIYVRAGEGGTPATSNHEYYDNGTIPFIKIDDLQNKYIKTNKDCITELGLQKSSAWIVPANSIIYSNGATIGAISINLFPVCTKQGILGVVPKTKINVEFLYYFMTSTTFAKAVERIVTEGTMRTAYLKDINHIPCPVPCSVKQDEIAKLLSTLSEKLENEVIFQMKLQKQKEFLLSQMFR